MTSKEALALVLELAESAVLSSSEANENELQDERQRQLAACAIVQADLGEMP